jgi:hypothetical protein
VKKLAGLRWRERTTEIPTPKAGQMTLLRTGQNEASVDGGNCSEHLLKEEARLGGRASFDY